MQLFLIKIALATTSSIPLPPSFGSDLTAQIAQFLLDFKDYIIIIIGIVAIATLLEIFIGSIRK